jgi:hypothetical protein
MGPKRCVTCHVDKPLEAFNRRRSSRDGRQDRCRDCCKQWYVENRVPHMATALARKRRIRAEYRVLMGEYLQAHPCVDCDEDDIRVLEFDHPPGVEKVDDVAAMMARQFPWQKILDEIGKCDVCCANCHRKRTAERGNHWRHAFYRARAAERLGALSRRA